jgi:hypothetical protein
MPCRCPRPADSDNPRNRGSCVKCGRAIPDEWNTKHIAGLLDQVRAIFPGKPPPNWQEFVRWCNDREFRGRDLFGLSYLDKDNCLEGMEEAADGANYAMFDVLRARRQGTHTDDALALTAVYHAFELFDALARLRGKHGGAPS